MHYYQNCNIRDFEGGFHDQPNQMLCGNQEKFIPVRQPLSMMALLITGAANLRILGPTVSTPADFEEFSLFNNLNT